MNCFLQTLFHFCIIQIPSHNEIVVDYINNMFMQLFKLYHISEGVGTFNLHADP